MYIHHDADDTNLLLPDKSLKKINKHISHDLKLLNIWLRANKTSQSQQNRNYIPKPQSNITKHLNFRIIGQYIRRINEVKYLRLISNEFLSQSTYYTLLKKKLNWAIGLLSKVQHFNIFTSQNLLKTLYYSPFHSHLIYGCQVWGQYHVTELRKIETLQHKRKQSES